MPTYRSVADSELHAYRALTAYAFRPHEVTPRSGEQTEETPPWAQLSADRGLFDDGELVSTIAHYWHTLRVRGEWHTVGGVANVSTPPKHRRNGYVRTMLAESLAEYREKEIAFSALWPFDTEFYRRLGYERCADQYRITCSPDALAFIGDESAGGTFVELTPEDIPALDAVYTTCHDHDLAMDRTEAWWQKRVFDYRTQPFVAGVERDGTLVGYLVYTIEDTDDGRQLTVHERSYRDVRAYRELLRYCRYHDSQVTSLQFDVEQPLLWELTPDPSSVRVERRSGAMFRVVDVERGLSAIDYADTGSVVLEIADSDAPWNDGRFELTVTDNSATCVPSTDPSAIELDISALGAIVSGYRSPATLAEYETIEGTDAAIETLDRLLPATEPSLVEFF
ncbi:GNAT family N-acetyltransferase [Halocatena halophila]|uniref:GNAT family N-acetyltransferase n=1 Tax=Halocatena halophila TaxID=2814576 RepID=UPI002ED3A036